MRIYIESTIPSYLVARPSRDPIQAERQRLTREWWVRKRGQHELFASDAVLKEIAIGEYQMAQLRLDCMHGILLLQETFDVRDLARKILNKGIVPLKAELDAMHIALACAHDMEILLSWNYRHLANVAIISRLRPLVEAAGYKLPVICTPADQMGA